MRPWSELTTEVVRTVGGGAQSAVRLRVGEAVVVSQRCHGSHGQTGQVVIVPVVQVPLVGISFDCVHKASISYTASVL